MFCSLVAAHPIKIVRLLPSNDPKSNSRIHNVISTSGAHNSCKILFTHCSCFIDSRTHSKKFALALQHTYTIHIFLHILPILNWAKSANYTVYTGRHIIPIFPNCRCSQHRKFNFPSLGAAHQLVPHCIVDRITIVMNMFSSPCLTWVFPSLW